MAVSAPLHAFGARRTPTRTRDEENERKLLLVALAQEWKENQSQVKRHGSNLLSFFDSEPSSVLWSSREAMGSVNEAVGNTCVCAFL